MISLSIETVDTLLRIAGHRIASELDNPETLGSAMSKSKVSEEMRQKACGEAGEAYSQVYQHGTQEDVLTFIQSMEEHIQAYSHHTDEDSYFFDVAIKTGTMKKLLRMLQSR